MRSDLLDIEVWVITQTEKAVLVNSPETGNDNTWLPRSAFEWAAGEPDVHRRDFLADITISRRTAEEKGLA